MLDPGILNGPAKSSYLLPTNDQLMLLSEALGEFYWISRGDIRGGQTGS
jgi:hypothetical protein